MKNNNDNNNTYISVPLCGCNLRGVDCTTIYHFSDKVFVCKQVPVWRISLIFHGNKLDEHVRLFGSGCFVERGMWTARQQLVTFMRGCHQRRMIYHQTFMPLGPYIVSLVNFIWHDTLYPVYTIQPAVKPVVKLVVKPVSQPCWTNSCSFNRLSNRVVQPVWQPIWQPVVPCIQTFNWLSNQFGNRFDNRLYRVNGALEIT